MYKPLNRILRNGAPQEPACPGSERPLARRVGASIAAALAASACTTTAPTRLDQPQTVESAVQQPFEDLNLVRMEVPAVLRQAAHAPYAAPEPADCPGLAVAIGELDALLGPDLDRPPAEDEDEAEALISGLIRGAVGLPFGGVIRRVTGAAARDRDLRRAILAGVARRSFLKGLASSHGCPA